MLYPYCLPDHPIVRNMERTGYPDGREPVYPRCPVCGEECETIYKNDNLDIIGCDNCDGDDCDCDDGVTMHDAWEIPDCFPWRD